MKLLICPFPSDHVFGSSSLPVSFLSKWYKIIYLAGETNFFLFSAECWEQIFNLGDQQSWGLGWTCGNSQNTEDIGQKTAT